MRRHHLPSDLQKWQAERECGKASAALASPRSPQCPTTGRRYKALIMAASRDPMWYLISNPNGNSGLTPRRGLDRQRSYVPDRPLDRPRPNRKVKQHLRSPAGPSRPPQRPGRRTYDRILVVRPRPHQTPVNLRPGAPRSWPAPARGGRRRTATGTQPFTGGRQFRARPAHARSPPRFAPGPKESTATKPPPNCSSGTGPGFTGTTSPRGSSSPRPARPGTSPQPSAGKRRSPPCRQEPFPAQGARPPYSTWPPASPAQHPLTCGT